MSNLELTLDTLRQLRALGVSVVLDDFGDRALLARLPQELRPRRAEDRPVLHGRRSPGSPADEALVTAIVEMARGLSLRVVAEGVEREEQVAFLRSAAAGSPRGSSSAGRFRRRRPRRLVAGGGLDGARRSGPQG